MQACGWDMAAADGVAMLDVLMDMEQYPSLARASSALGGFVRIYNALCQAHDACWMRL